MKNSKLCRIKLNDKLSLKLKDALTVFHWNIMFVIVPDLPSVVNVDLAIKINMLLLCMNVILG